MASIIDMSIEKGLMAKPTKMGTGDKERGYKVRATTLKSMCFGMSAVMVLLLAGMAIYHIAFVLEVEKGRAAVRDGEIRHGKSAVQSIRLGASLQSALMDQNSNHDLVRMMKRVNNVVERQFETLEGSASDESMRAVLLDSKSSISGYIEHEIQDFMKEHTKDEEKNRVRLEKIAKMQKKSLRSILNSVSEGKLGALEDMLDDLFENVHETPEVALPAALTEELVELTDRLLDEGVSFDEGWEKVAKLESTYKVSLQIKRSEVDNSEELGDMLEEICENAKINEGRSRLAAIEREWKNLQDGVDSPTPPGHTLSEEDEETDPTVLLMLKVQDMVDEGIVPIDWLDFDEIADADYDEDDDEKKDDDDDDDVHSK